IILLMGVAGSGKTTVGKLLAERLGWPFHDADDLHSAANREKMHRGIPLNDADRRPWLEAVRRLIAVCVASGTNAVVVCSALKQSYRAKIIADRLVVKLVYLRGSYELIAERLAHRPDHFFDPHLLRSQFETLEEPVDAIIEDVTSAAPAIVDSIIAKLAP